MRCAFASRLSRLRLPTLAGLRRSCLRLTRWRLTRLCGLLQRIRRFLSRRGRFSQVALLQTLPRLPHRLLTVGRRLARLACLLRLLAQTQHLRIQPLGRCLQLLRELLRLRRQLLLPLSLRRLTLLSRVGNLLKAA